MAGDEIINIPAVKSKARREFAERLKEKVYNGTRAGAIFVRCVDEVLKEMVGEGE